MPFIGGRDCRVNLVPPPEALINSLLGSDISGWHNSQPMFRPAGILSMRKSPGGLAADR
jgi:hypothetical protein